MPIPDPFQQQHERLGEEAFKKVTQRADQWAQREQLIQQSIVWHLFGWGLIGNLWKYSKTALFLYVIPAWVGLFGVGLGFVAGNTLMRSILEAQANNVRPPVSLGAPGMFYLYGIFSGFLVAASMAFGFYKASRAGRLIGMVYLCCVCVFWVIAWLSPPSPPRQRRGDVAQATQQPPRDSRQKAPAVQPPQRANTAAITPPPAPKDNTVYLWFEFLCILGMVVCFLSTVAVEVWGGFRNRRQAME